VELKIPHRKKISFYGMSQRAWDWMDFFDKRPRFKKTDMRFGGVIWLRIGIDGGLL
jgi:hypothetical protein